MTNIVALCLILSTFLAAEVWTPTPAMTHRTEPEGDVIVKDGHRVVVVEYDREGATNTKILISPPETKHGEAQEEGTGKGVFRNVKERVKETASHLPNIGQGISQPERSKEGGAEEETEGEARERHATPGELICDAFGKCRHKIASTLGKAKDRISRAPEEAREIGETVSEKAREAASEAAEEVGEDAAAKAHGAKETVARMAHGVKETVGHKAQDAKDKVAEKAHKMKEAAAHKAHEAKDIAGHEAQELRDKAKEKAREAKESAWRRVKTAAAEVLSPAKVGSVVGLTGLATAYGTCMWVTFVSSYVLAGVLGRHQFGLVQSKVYPLYFKAVSLGTAVGLLGHILSRRRRLLTRSADMWQALNLLVAFLIVEGNASFLEPRATKAMFDRMKAEKEEGRGRDTDEPQPPGTRREEEEVRQRLRKLGDRLQRLNTYSSWLNILTLMSLTWHIVYLGLRLSVTC